MRDLAEAREIIQQQDEALKQIIARSIKTGIAIKSSTAMVLTDEGERKVKSYLTLADGNLLNIRVKKDLKVKPGQTVGIFVQEDAAVITHIMDDSIATGETCVVLQILPEDRILVDLHGHSLVVFDGGYKPQEGDTVLVFQSLLVVGIHEKAAEDKKVGKTGVSWNDIGGLREVKEAIQELVIKPITHKELYAAYGQSSSKGALLYGPPGNGKTMIGKAIATNLAELFKSTADGFIYVKGPEILSRYVGEGEANIRNLFRMAEKFHDKHGVPAVLFIDEAESILSKRGTGRSSDIDKTIVPQFLTEMDGIRDSRCIVILATNRPDQLDSAVIREGRIDRKIYVSHPDEAALESILDINLSKVTVKDKKEDLISMVKTELLGTKFPLYHLTLSDGSKQTLCLKDILSGAMIANLVTTATGYAIRKDIEAGNKKPTGVTRDCLGSALLNLYGQHRELYHTEELDHYQSRLKDKKISNVVKA